MATAFSNRGAITERRMVVVRIGAAEEETSTGMVPPIVTRNKRRRHFRRRLASGDGCGTGITGFAPVSEREARIGVSLRALAELGEGEEPSSTGSKARDRGGLEPLIEKTGRKNARRKSNCSNQLDRIHTIKRERTY